MHWRGAILAAAIALTACTGVRIDPVPVTQAPEPEIGYRAAPVRLGRVLAAIPRGTEVGGYVFGLNCAGPYERVTWTSGRRFMDTAEFSDLFAEALKNAGHDVAGDLEALDDLEGPGDDLLRAEYVVSARIKDIKLNLCRETDLFLNAAGVSGEASMIVDWTIYSRVERKLVQRFTTKGYWKAMDATSDGQELAVAEAFAAAAANLAADPAFHAIVMQAPPAPTAEDVLDQETTVSSPPAPLTLVATQSAPTSPAEAVQASVVVSGGAGHGSGFFIAPDLLLTNAHVVGEALRVRVDPVRGKAVAGRVVARDHKRDVALVRLEKSLKSDIKPLAVRTAPLSISEEVFAIGAPTRESLSGTLTRGIVSAFRHDTNTRLKLIQADVTIHPGSSGGPLVDGNGQVAGIAVAAYRIPGSEASAGLNLFIPIQDALDALGLAKPDAALDQLPLPPT